MSRTPHPPPQDLARWLRGNATAVAGGVAASPLPGAVAAQLRGASLPEGEPPYWPAVTRLVALGWIDDAIELLGLHSAWLRYDGSGVLEAADGAARALVGALEAATLLLRRFPVLSAAGVVQGAGRECATPSEFAAYRRTWQAQSAALAADGGMWGVCEGADAATARGLRAVLGVLAGDEEALAAAAASWLELLVSQLLHVYPAARPQAELRQLAQRAFEAGGGASASDFLQVAAALLEACCELDAQAAMRVCSSFCSSWFMAHAPDLMAAHPAGEGALLRCRAGLGGCRLFGAEAKGRWVPACGSAGLQGALPWVAVLLRLDCAACAAAAGAALPCRRGRAGARAASPGRQPGGVLHAGVCLLADGPRPHLAPGRRLPGLVPRTRTGGAGGAAAPAAAGCGGAVGGAQGRGAGALPRADAGGGG